MDLLLVCAVPLILLATVVISYYEPVSASPCLKKIPGPVGLPIVGYIPFLGKKPFETFTELSKKYGAIFQVRLGTRTAVVLNGRSVIQKAFVQNSALVGRPSVPSVKAFTESGLNKFGDRTGDAIWKFSRKIALKALSMFASSKNSRLEQLIHSTTDNLVEDFVKTEGGPVDPNQIIHANICAITGSMIFGSQFNQKEDPLLNNLLLFFQETSSDLYKLNSVLDFLPFGSYIMHHKIRKIKKGYAVYGEKIQKYVDSHKCNEQVTNIADALNKVAEETTEEELQNVGISRKAIRYIADDLFSAGFFTTAESLRWSLNLLASNQHAQKQLHQELDRELHGEWPSMDYRTNLVFTEAVLLEVLRFSTMLPLNMYHEALEDTDIEGFFVPKDTIVIVNAWVSGVHRDETIFKNAFTFQPERFLVDNGTKIDSEMAQMILAFGTGKRRCAGENLARQELFMILAAIFQKFQVDVAPGEKLQDSPLNPIYSGFFRPAGSPKLVFTRR